MEKSVGNNVVVQIDAGNKLTIKVDLEKTFGPSKSGKTTVIASTLGNIQLAPGIFLGLNVYKK